MVLLASLLNNFVQKEKQAEQERRQDIQEKETLKFSSGNPDKKQFKSSVSYQSVADTIMKLSLIAIIFYLICGGIAAYSSWNSNGKIGYGKTRRVFYAIFAFLCPFEYLTIHLTYKTDLLKYMERTKTEFVEIVPSPTSASAPVSPQ